MPNSKDQIGGHCSEACPNYVCASLGDNDFCDLSHELTVLGRYCRLAPVNTPGPEHQEVSEMAFVMAAERLLLGTDNSQMARFEEASRQSAKNGLNCLI